MSKKKGKSGSRGGRSGSSRSASSVSRARRQNSSQQKAAVRNITDKYKTVSRNSSENKKVLTEEEKGRGFANYKSSPGQILESVYDLIFLIFVFWASSRMLQAAGENKVITLFGWMAFILAVGESFHLIPRFIMNLRGRDRRTEFVLGLGKMISVIANSACCVVLYYIWENLFPEQAEALPQIVKVVVWITVLARIAISLFPQNKWFQDEGNPEFARYRSVMYIVTGITLAGIYLSTANTGGYGLWQVAVAVLISVACDLFMALRSDKSSGTTKVLVMILGTLAWAWILGAGLRLVSLIG